MKKALYLVFLLSSSFFLQAQHAMLAEEDSVQIAPMKIITVYFSPSLSVNQFVGTGASFLGIHLGMVYSDKVDVNVFYSRILDNFKKQIIFPGSHEYNQSNVGIEVQYSFLKKRIRPHVGVGFQYAEASWEPVNDSNDTFLEYIIMYDAFLGANWMINKIFTFTVNAGYNFTQKVDMIGLSSDDFEGFKADFLLKVRFLSF